VEIENEQSANVMPGEYLSSIGKRLILVGRRLPIAATLPPR
jgi:hypothetical protein